MKESIITFVWDDNFITGIESVDRQHHGLVDLFNRLSEKITLGQRQDAADIESVFVKLNEYAGYHFDEEERLMAETGLSALHVDEHVAEHRAFAAQVAALHGSAASTRARPHAIVDFLVAWLGDHILRQDQAMARQIERVSAGITPERAYAAELEGIPRSTDALLKAMRNLYAVVSSLNSSLAASNQQLEQRVAERTATLDLLNDRLREANERLTVRAQTDGLLGIANRAHFESVLSLEWERAIRSRRPLGLLMIDFDHFKRYNDTYGHLAGDACLKAVALAITARMKRPADLVARYGGEELVVLLPETESGGANSVAKDICAAIAELRMPHRGSPQEVVTVSIGVAARVPAPGDMAGEMVAAADDALYAAKEAGRNRVTAAD